MLTSCSTMQDTPKKLHTPAKTIVSNEDLYLKIFAQQKAKSSVVLLAPLSGSNANLGKSVLNAAIQSNSNDDLDIYVVDTNNVPDKLNIEQFPNIKAVIGPIFSEEAVRFAPIFSSVPIFSLSNNVKINNGHVYACGLAPQDELKTIFEHMRTNNIDSIAFVLPKGKFFEELVASAREIATEYGIAEENIDVLSYRKMSSQDFLSFVNSCGKQAFFVYEPLADISSISAPVFTMEAVALANPVKWNSAKIALAENENQKSFIETYQKNFREKPTVISLIASDLISVIDYAASNNTEMFDTNFEGLCGMFSVNQGKSVERKLRIESISDRKAESEN